MKKKWLWAVPAVLVLLVLLGPVLVPGERVAGYLAERIHATTGADVVLGSVKVRIWPGMRVTLGKGSLQGDLGETGLESVAWRELAVGLDLGSLLRGKPVISAADVQGLSLSGTRDRHRFALQEGRIHAEGLELVLDNRNGQWLPPDRGIPLDFTAGALTLQNMEFKDLAGQGVVRNDSLRLDPVQGHLGSGTVEAAMTVALDRGQARYVRFATSVRAVPAAVLLADLAPDLGARWEGDLDGAATGGYRLEEGRLVRESLDAEGHLEGAAGVIHARKWLDGVAAYLGSRQDLMDIRYDHLEQPFAVHDGRYQVDLKLAGPQTDWSVSGAVGLDGELDLAVLVMLPPGFTPDLGGYALLAEALRGKDGRLTLALDVTGRAARPRVSLNLGESMRGAGDDAGSALGKGLGGLLDKLKVR